MDSSGAVECAAPVRGGVTRWVRFPYLPLAFTGILLGIAALPRVREVPQLFLAFAAAAGLLVVWTLVLSVWSWRRGKPLLVDLVPPSKAHYIQGTVQTLIYAYWAQYWSQIYLQIPLIFAQLVFFYAFDSLLSWSRGRTWRLGCGPLPIILSTNVFLCFKDEWFIYQFAVMAVAALGKEFIKWERDGRRTHVFNPSAFALALFAVILLASGTTSYTWAGRIADTFAQPPNIYVLVFLLGLVVQYFFSVTLMTFAAAGTLALLSLAYYWIYGTYFFVFTNIPAPVFLGLHLLVTDPATSPRTNTGRILFGIGYGLLTFFFYGLLTNLDQPTLYDKLLPIPLLNLSVKWIDRVAQWSWIGRFNRWEAKFQPRKVNLAHMGAWSAVFVWMLSAGFVQGKQPGNTYEFWKHALDEGKHNADKGLLEFLKSETRGGSAAAWNELGNIYLEGKIVPKDQLTAVRYYAQATKLGSIAGAANLANQYLRVPNSSEPKVVVQAFDILENACNADADGAIFYLVGRAYEQGRGRPMNKSRAIALQTQGCSRGYADSCEALARIRAEHGVAPDTVK